MKDLNPDGWDYIQSLVDIDGTLYFEASDGIVGRELWKLLAPAAPPPGPVTPATGTVGTALEIRGAGFGTKKPRVEMALPSAKGPRKLRLKVLDWTDTVIHAAVPRAVARPGRCDVTVTPKGKGAAPQVLALSFEFLPPRVTAVAPDPTAAPWAAGQEIVVTGLAFGTRRGTVDASWTTPAGVVTKRCKALAWPKTAAGGGDGPGDVRVRLPRSFAPSSAELTLRNAVGVAVWDAE